ncbi:MULTISPECIES: Fe-S cluster assembly sulfur transfer protein SufU [unclassified Cryobacterium]|uniref:Fe-S cluster assembly sulfur transfer protein SufU n=1 Tax=unclassified Cryobacterium TaxID=2649013 RepID=UPI000CE3AB4F|nr:MULTISPECIES: SUF system NifU family Fe-S cluster assembly protein [unclassified Cryobacterium]
MASTSSGIAGLYQEMIIDHGRRPRNFRKIDGATRTVEALNPLCGDQLTLSVQVTDGVIADVAFTGSGCTISQASASLMTMAVKGLQPEEALTLFARVHTMLTSESEDEASLAGVGKLAVLSGVWEYPTRVKCASLAWQALRNALEDGNRQDEKGITDHGLRPVHDR